MFFHFDDRIDDRVDDNLSMWTDDDDEIRDID